jgi:RNA polymerase sigma-70 factor (ECF subfamily)
MRLRPLLYPYPPAMSSTSALPTLSGPQWMERIRCGEKAAFEALFEAYAPGLCAYLARYVRSREVAEDVVQDIFLRLWRQRDEIRVTGSISSYLFLAAKHRALDQIRHDKVVDRFTALHTARSEDSLGSSETALLTLLEVNEAIAQLPARRRLIFNLSREQGMTHGAIAELLGLSVKTVEAQIGLALKALRSVLE